MHRAQPSALRQAKPLHLTTPKRRHFWQLCGGLLALSPTCLLVLPMQPPRRRRLVRLLGQLKPPRRLNSRISRRNPLLPRLPIRRVRHCVPILPRLYPCTTLPWRMFQVIQFSHIRLHCPQGIMAIYSQPIYDLQDYKYAALSISTGSLRRLSVNYLPRSQMSNLCA